MSSVQDAPKPTPSNEYIARVGLPGFGYTERADRWWNEPLATAIGLGVFFLYATWATLNGRNFRFGPYLSPFFSPYLAPRGFPLPASLLVVWIPGLFRLSCYYYRKAYYQAIFLSPPACAVSEAPRAYTGENRPPLRWFPIMHRWTLYLSLLVLASLWLDTLRSFSFGGRFGVGIGSLVMLANVVLLSGFTGGCHALRSLAGGNLRCFSCARFGQTRYRLWRGVSFLNVAHMQWAWLSLLSVVFTDLYIRLCAAGAIKDIRIF